MVPLCVDQLPVQLIVLVVADRRAGVDVVAAIVLRELVDKPQIIFPRHPTANLAACAAPVESRRHWSGRDARSRKRGRSLAPASSGSSSRSANSAASST